MESEKEIMTCILTKRDSGGEEFISILDWTTGYSELRINNDKPFGLPLEEINVGEMFFVKTEIIPGQMTTSVDKCPVSEYTKLLLNETVMSEIEELEIITRSDIERVAQSLRSDRIDTIINENI